MNIDSQEHWEKIYSDKDPHELSWTQKEAGLSAAFFKSAELPIASALIDVGSGMHGMIPYWLSLGYTNLTALDISASALRRLKESIDNKEMARVKYITSNITQFDQGSAYDYWNDRAVFHFLTDEKDKATYVNKVNQKVDGYFCIGAFSKSGPIKCSGREICQYDMQDLIELFAENFELIRHGEEEHITPFETSQNFVYCLFKKKS